MTRRTFRPRSAARWGTGRDQQTAPPPKRHFEHSICRTQPQLPWSRVPEVSLHHPPDARSSRPVPHSPPTPTRSGHPVGYHAARNFALQCLTPPARRAARQPTAWPSARPHRRRRCSRPFICTGLA